MFEDQLPNQFHQLLITPSRRFSVTTEGFVIYHSELLKVSLKHLTKLDFIPLVHFVIRDKYSGVFYAESVIPDEFPNIEDFLHRAWSLKENYFFGGIPDSLSVPSYAVSSKLSMLLKNLNISEFKPYFNNEAGVRVIRIIESELLKYVNYPYKNLQRLFGQILTELNHNRTPNQSLKTDKYDRVWLNNIKNITLPPAQSVMKTASEKMLNLEMNDIQTFIDGYEKIKFRRLQKKADN